MEVKYTEPQREIFNKLTHFMLEYNEKVNLTRITKEDDIWIKHYDDSVLPLLLTEVKEHAKVIDVGTGAGFPGLPWKILRPDLNITLLDSLKKRIIYLDELIKYLQLNDGNIHAIHARSEELAFDSGYRECYDVTVSRAVANLPALSEYCLPFVKIGGIFLAMKGTQDESEFSHEAVKSLGGKIEQIKEYELRNGDKRNLVIIKKISHTPSKYPRKHVNIVKKPL